MLGSALQTHHADTLGCNVTYSLKKKPLSTSHFYRSDIIPVYFNSIYKFQAIKITAKSVYMHVSNKTNDSTESQSVGVFTGSSLKA